jgi:hypothetical protein
MKSQSLNEFRGLNTHTAPALHAACFSKAWLLPRLDSANLNAVAREAVHGIMVLVAGIQKGLMTRKATQKWQLRQQLTGENTGWSKFEQRAYIPADDRCKGAVHRQSAIHATENPVTRARLQQHIAAKIATKKHATKIAT